MPNFPKNASCSSTSDAYYQPQETTGSFFVVLSKSMITNTSCHADGYRAFMITNLNTPIWLSETVEEASFYKYEDSVVLKAKMVPESFATIGAWQRYFQIREGDWSLQISSWRFAHHKEYRCNAQPEEQVCKTLSAAILKIDKEQRTALIEEKRISKPATGA